MKVSTLRLTLNLTGISAKPKNIVASDETVFSVHQFVPELECFSLRKNKTHPHINCYLIKEGIFAQADLTSKTISQRYSLSSDFHGLYLEWLSNQNRTKIGKGHEPGIGIDFKALGAACREAKEAAGLSATYLVAKYGLNGSYFSRTEQGKIADAFPGNHLLALYQEGISIDSIIKKALTGSGDIVVTTDDRLNSLKALLHELPEETVGILLQMVSSMIRTQAMDESNNKALVAHMDVHRTGTE